MPKKQPGSHRKVRASSGDISESQEASSYLEASFKTLLTRLMAKAIHATSSVEQPGYKGGLPHDLSPRAGSKNVPGVTTVNVHEPDASDPEYSEMFRGGLEGTSKQNICPSDSFLEGDQETDVMVRRSTRRSTSGPLMTLSKNEDQNSAVAVEKLQSSVKRSKKKHPGKSVPHSLESQSRLGSDRSSSQQAPHIPKRSTRAKTVHEKESSGQPMSVSPQSRQLKQISFEETSGNDEEESASRLRGARTNGASEQHLNSSRIQRVKLSTVKRKLQLDVTATPSQVGSTMRGEQNAGLQELHDVTEEKFHGSFASGGSASYVARGSLSAANTGRATKVRQARLTESLQASLSSVKMKQTDTAGVDTSTEPDGARKQGSLGTATGDTKAEMHTERSETRLKRTRTSPRSDVLKAIRNGRDTFRYLAKWKMRDFLGTTIPADTMDAIHECSETFFSMLDKKLREIAYERRSLTVTQRDVIRFIRRFAGVKNVHGLFALVEQHMPYDLRRQMIPCTRLKKRRKKQP